MTAILNFGSRPTSDNVNARQCHIRIGQSDNMGVSWNRGSISHRSKVITTSGSVVAILNSGNRPTSVNVGSARDVSGMASNVQVAVGIMSPAHCVQ